MLIKKNERQARRGALAAALAGQTSGTIDRRAFLRRSGLAAGGLAALGTLPLGGVRKAQAGPPAAAGAPVTLRKNICTHCSVGCTVTAEVSNGVWIGVTDRLGATTRHLIHPRRVDGGRVHATDETGRERTWTVHRIIGATLDTP